MEKIMIFLREIPVEQYVEILRIVSAELAVLALVFWVLTAIRRLRVSPKKANEEIRILMLPPEERPIDMATAIRKVRPIISDTEKARIDELFVVSVDACREGWTTSRRSK